MIDRIENAMAAIMAASIVIAPVTLTFYFFEYIFKILSVL